MTGPLRQQRRGKGSPKYRSKKNNSKGPVDHKNAEGIKGEVKDIIHDPSRSAPVAVVEFEDGETRNVLAPENLQTGEEIQIGISAEIKEGNTLPLEEIPEGVPIHNIELQPGDGGQMVRASGTYGFVVTHEKDKVRIRLPSKKFKTLNKKCRATIGKVAAGGRKDKPFVKAGNKHHAKKAKGKEYPHVSGIAMNAVDHPFGGSAEPGKPKTVSRHASPGRKVGSIGAKQSGNQED
ncbi:MAG: 50S ribosomal protein L2 [Candidatus Nanohaloarchaea archaeon]